MAFKDILGHKKQIRILKGLIRKDRIPSSVLLKGESGIGKRATFINLVKSVNCLSSVDYDCCDLCNSCRKIDRGIHPDVRVLEDTEKEITIEQIRAIEDFVFTRPCEGRKKALIIDNAQNMNLYAQNAFLKTLEEPPPDCMLILITSMPDLLLDTIKSRCFQIAFSPLAAEEFRLFAERLNPVNETLKALYQGCPGALFSEQTETEVNNFFAKLKDMEAEEAKEKWKDGKEMKDWLGFGLVYLRDRALYALMGDESPRLIGLRHTKKTSLNEILRAYEGFLALFLRSDSNLNKKIVWNLTKELLMFQR